MKKYIIIPTIIFSISSLFLASCGKSDKDETSKTERAAMKETPETTPVVTEIDSIA